MAALLLLAGPAAASTDGELDSGTFLSPTIFLTAGHCAEAPAARTEIWFDAASWHIQADRG